MASLSERAYQEIRRKIVTLELPPSTVINEGRLMSELGLGRTPIREALHRLALENLVIILPRRGMFVSHIRLTDLQQIFEVRTELERLCIRLAVARVTPAQLAALDELAQEFREHRNSGNNQALMDLDRRFHLLFYAAADNSFLQEALERLYYLSLRLWYLALNKIGPMQEALDQHLIIVEALKKRDAALAEATIVQHIANFHERFRHLFWEI